MTKTFVPLLALTLSLLPHALFAADQQTFSHVIFEITPKAVPYVHEINGNVAVTFAHNLDPKHFGAFATLTNGTTLGNWNHYSKPAPEGVPLLVYAEDSAANTAVTTITFHGLPFAKVKSITVLTDINAGEHPHIAVELPASFGKPPPKPAPVSLTFDIKASTVTTSAGLKIESSGPAHFASSNGVNLEAHLSTATVTNSHGDLLLKAELIDIFANAKPAATQPAPTK